MSKTFRQLMKDARQRAVLEERLSYGGHYETISPSSAIVEDWLFVLAEAQSDIAQSCRHLSNPDEAAAARRAVRKHLAELAEHCEAMVQRLSRL